MLLGWFAGVIQGRLPQDAADFAVFSSHMRRIGDVLEHSFNNSGKLLHGNGQAGPGEYYSDTALGYLQTAEESPGSGWYVWSDAPEAVPGWDNVFCWHNHKKRWLLRDSVS